MYKNSMRLFLVLENISKMSSNLSICCTRPIFSHSMMEPYILLFLQLKTKLYDINYLILTYIYLYYFLLSLELRKILFILGRPSESVEKS